ncbi:unnamed protein product [Gongylonema pulchrum]|uniref:Sm protein G n=1 Tax=Gongylonema pulchrum TaxID=637853 RepID=A0A183EC83_9BILA|nr:unnamed protein product [Gongylonema pulchrum]
MIKTYQPELKRYMGLRMDLKLNGNRSVTGVLCGFDAFMNVVIDEAVENMKVTLSPIL